MNRILTTIFLLLSTLTFGQTQAFYTDRAVATLPFQNIYALTALSYAPVRVCTLPLTQLQPCLPVAIITDTFGNTLNLSANGGQLLTDSVGRFSFGCVPGLYQVQVTAAANNTPTLNYPITCPFAAGNALNAPVANLVITEGTSPGGAANADVCYADAATHQLKCSRNNGTFFNVPFPDVSTTWTTQQTFSSLKTNVNRLDANQGTALSGGNITLGGNWGTSPSSGITGFDSAFFFTATSGTGSPGANPTVTVTFADGTWVTSPVCVASRTDTLNVPSAYWAVSSTSVTTVTLTFVGTPSTSTSYQANVICIGR